MIASEPEWTAHSRMRLSPGSSFDVKRDFRHAPHRAFADVFLLSRWNLNPKGGLTLLMLPMKSAGSSSLVRKVTGEIPTRQFGGKTSKRNEGTRAGYTLERRSAAISKSQ